MAEPMTPPGANPPSPGMDQYPAIDPAAMTVIEGVEHKLDSMLQRDVHVYLWVDINGLKIIDKKSKHVQWSARLNTIVQVRARRAHTRHASGVTRLHGRHPPLKSPSCCPTSATPSLTAPALSASYMSPTGGRISASWCEHARRAALQQ